MKQPVKTDSTDAEVQQRVLDTAKELAALIAQAQPNGPDRLWEDFRAVVDLHEGLYDVQAALLSEFLELALPDLARRAQPLREWVLEGNGPREGGLELLENLLGTVPARARQLEWLDTPALRLTGDAPIRGFLKAKSDDTGVVIARVLYALTDGRLAIIDEVGTWNVVDRYVQPLRTIADAALVEPRQAVEDFPLHQMLSALRECLWDERRAHAQTPYAPDITERRVRFTALVADLGRAMGEHADRLRRVGDSPA